MMKFILNLRQVLVLGSIATLCGVVVTSAFSQQMPRQQNDKGKERQKPTEQNVHAEITRQVLPLMNDGVVGQPLSIRTHEIYTVSYALPSVNQNIRVSIAPSPGSISPAVGKFQLREDYAAEVTVDEGLFVAGVAALPGGNGGRNGDNGGVPDKLPICPIIILTHIDVSGCGTLYGGATVGKYSYLFLIEGEFVEAHTHGKPDIKERITENEANTHFLRSDREGPIEKLLLADDCIAGQLRDDVLMYNSAIDFNVNIPNAPNE